MKINVGMEPGMVEELDYGVHDLCSVKSKPVTAQDPVQVFDIFAMDGCWQNKYTVTRLHRGVDPHTHNPALLVRLLNLGRFYADGRIEPAKKKRYREVWWPLDASRSPYIRVVPTAVYKFGVFVRGR